MSDLASRCFSARRANTHGCNHCGGRNPERIQRLPPPRHAHPAAGRRSGEHRHVKGTNVGQRHVGATKRHHCRITGTRSRFLDVSSRHGRCAAFVQDLSDEADALRAERDENTERRAFLPSELVSVTQSIREH